MSTLSIAGIQTTITWERKPLNLKHFAKILDRLTTAVDLIILPEMFQTGFTMHAHEFAEDMEGETLKWMKQLSKAHNCCLSGSIIFRDEDVCYNRFLFVKSSGEIEFYDKRHLFTYGGEHEQFSNGIQESGQMIQLNGWNILPRVCYDLRFPVWTRYAKDADLLIFTANWPNTRIVHWNALLKARAIENQVYTIGINRIGVDGNGLHYSGSSSAYQYDGHCIQNINDQDSLLIVHLEKEKQSAYRSKFPFLRDADKFQLL